MSSVGHARNSLSTGEVSVAGSFSGAITRLVCQPLDVAKIRLQLQAEIGQKRKYKNLLELVYKLLREEGFGALWKGHVPAQFLSITYGFVSFAAFESFAATLNGQNRDDTFNKTVINFMCGAGAGCAGTIFSFPFDMVRTRLVAQKTQVYSGTRDAMGQIYRSAGLTGFYKGFVPTCLAVAPQSGLQFGLYSLFTQMLGGWVNKDDSRLGHGVITVQGSLICGAMAGMATKAILYPLDVVKKRLQVSGWVDGRKGLGETPHYKNLRHCLVSLVKVEGVRSFYKGFTPALIKAVSTTSISFMAYEWTCKLFLLRRRIIDCDQ